MSAATTNQLIGGAMNGIDGSSAVANGYLIISLSQDASVNGNTLVASGVETKIPLDASGNVVTSPAQQLWPNDVLSPANTFYTVSGYTAEGQLVWGPNSQQVLSSPSPFNIGAWVPASVNFSNNTGAGVSSFNGRTGAVTPEVGDYSAFYEPIGSGSGAVTSVFGRRGAVVGQSGDYTAAQIANAAATNVSNTFAPVQTFNGGLNATFGVFSSYITAPNLMNSFNGRSGSVVPVSGDYNVSQITGAAPIASPTFTGVPAAPTATAGTNTTQLATTAFVTNAVGGAAFRSLTTTGTSGAATLTSGVLNIPQYTAGAVSSLTTTGTSGAATLTSGVLNIPQYAGAVSSLTTTGSSGVATLISGVLNIPNYAGGVTSVFGRTGAVVAVTNDYTAAQVTNAAAVNVTNTFSAAQTITAAVSPLTLTNTATSSFLGAATFLAPNMTNQLFFVLGHDQTSNNACTSGFHYAGAGSSSNALYFGFYSGSGANPFWATVGGSAGIWNNSPAYPLDVNGAIHSSTEVIAPTINATTGFQINGTALASTNLSDTTNLARLNAANTFSAAQTVNSTLSVGTVGSSGTWKIEMAPPTASSALFWIDNTNTQLRFSSGSVPGTGAVVIDTSGNLGAAGAITATLFNSAPISWTAIGNANVGGSLPASNTGSSNTATGQGALASNTSGTGSSAFGANSLNKNTTGSGNTAIGDGALVTNIIGNYNVAVGFDALSANTGDFNVAVGENSLPNNSSGGSNTGVGQSCMFGNTTGTGNTGVGMTSLHDIVTGSSNTAIGLNAGYTTSVALQTISSSTFVGANASASIDGLTNMSVIGSGAIGTASNQITLGNSSVTSVVTAGVLTAASLATTQTATATTTASDHSIPIKIGGTTYYVRLSSTP